MEARLANQKLLEVSGFQWRRAAGNRKSEAIKNRNVINIATGITVTPILMNTASAPIRRLTTVKAAIGRRTICFRIVVDYMVPQRVT